MSEYVGRVFAKSCERMDDIPDGVVQTCVTSPPYFGLRDYGCEGQIGLEPTVDAYVERLVGVFREVRRVLRDDGTAWLNLGDSYAGSPLGSYNGSPGLPNRERSLVGHKGSGGVDKVKASGLKPKDLIGVPWRVAFALQADGWWLRDAIIWHKPATMPSSVQDRCTPSYEFVFMLAKSARYYADMDAVRQPITESSAVRLAQNVAAQVGTTRAVGKTNGNLRAAGDPDLGANLRNVWTIPTASYDEAHFAVMPLALAQRCITIGTPPQGLVLDPFMGSGTTAEAAESLGRQWTGYELNPDYHALIAERTRQQSLLAAGS